MRSSFWNRLSIFTLIAASVLTVGAVQNASAATGTISGRITAGGVAVPAGSLQIVFIPYNVGGCSGGSPALQVVPVGDDGRYSYSLDTQYDYKVMFKPLIGAPRSSLFRWYFSANSGGTADGYEPAPNAATAATCLDLSTNGLTNINLDTTGSSVQLSGTLTSSSGSIVPPSSVFVTRSTENYLYDPNGYAARTSSDGTWEIAGVDANLPNVYVQVMVPANNANAPRFFAKKAGSAYELIPSAGVAACGDACKFNFGATDVLNMALRLPVMGQITGTISGPNGPVGAGQVCATAFSDGGSSATMYQLQVGSVCTNASGVYTIGLSYGSYRLQFTSQPKSPYMSEWSNNVSMNTGYSGAAVITVSAETPTATADGVLAIGKTISGRITNTSGNPIPGMTASAMMENAEFRNFMSAGYAITDENGEFTIYGLEAGTYSVMAQNLDYGMQWLGGGTRESATKFVIASGDAGAAGKNIAFPRGYAVSGNLTTANGSTANICVSAWAVSESVMGYGELAASSCYSAPGGWQLRGLKAGSYRLRFDAQTGDLRSTFLGGNDINTATVKVVTNADLTNVDVTIPAGKSITGRFVDDQGRAVSSVCVGAYLTSNSTWGMGNWSGSSCTGSNGEFKIRGLENGNYILRADMPPSSDFAPGYYTAGKGDIPPSLDRSMQNATMITITDSSQTTTLQPVTLKAGAKFTGTVVDGTTPTAGVCVNAFRKVNDFGWGEWTASSCSSGIDGTISLNGLPAGSYTFQVNPQSGSYQSGWYRTGLSTSTNQSLATSVLISTSSVSLGNISLVSGKNVEGTLTDGTSPIVGACVQALKDDGSYWGTWAGSACSNTAGKFKIRGLDPSGDYRFRVDVWMGDFRPGFITADPNRSIQSSPIGIAALRVDEDKNLGTVSMPTAPSIKGTVYSGSETAAVKEANVCVSAFDAVTIQWAATTCSAPNGAYALRGLTAGSSYKLNWWTQNPRLTPGWYQDKAAPTQAQNPSDATEVLIDSNGAISINSEVKTAVNLYLADGGKIFGTLTSGLCVAAWLQPASDTISRTDASAVSCTDDLGTFELRGLLPSTNYFLQVFKRDGTAVTQTSPGINVAVQTGQGTLAISAS
jgi:hypothetical protein